MDRFSHHRRAAGNGCHDKFKDCNYQVGCQRSIDCNWFFVLHEKNAPMLGIAQQWRRLNGGYPCRRIGKVSAGELLGFTSQPLFEKEASKEEGYYLGCG